MFSYSQIAGTRDKPRLRRRIIAFPICKGLQTHRLAGPVTPRWMLLQSTPGRPSFFSLSDLVRSKTGSRFSPNLKEATQSAEPILEIGGSGPRTAPVPPGSWLLHPQGTDLGYALVPKSHLTSTEPFASTKTTTLGSIVSEEAGLEANEGGAKPKKGVGLSKQSGLDSQDTARWKFKHPCF